MPAISSDDQFMSLALRLAKKGVGLTSPNPPVGALVVRSGKVLGEGWHCRAGEAHAELAAIKGAGGPAAVGGATLYVTLEPCSTHGRTPPCAEALINAGIGRVVWAIDDPNPAHSGRAAGLLHNAGIAVTRGVCEAAARSLLQPWTKFITTGLPWVIAKAGISWDGKITRPEGEGRWLTNDAARADAVKLRRRADAIIIGAETLRRDDPALTVRPALRGKVQPWRVVLTNSDSLPQEARLFNDEFKDRTLVYTRRSLDDSLRDLARRGVVIALVEGGGTTLAHAFAQRMVDEVSFYVAPFISGSGRPVVDPVHFTGGSVALREIAFKTIGDNLRVTARVAAMP
ncbi:MAG: bifunctional diaminohydroxyphosphoribosylaminopyrimidine deaminase/5-amino-6-(5-phosphoribosylamino)uracil reductase RibD [Verrucomicrobiales bacterium]